jgi:hypothetical protein
MKRIYKSLMEERMKGTTLHQRLNAVLDAKLDERPQTYLLLHEL